MVNNFILAAGRKPRPQNRNGHMWTPVHAVHPLPPRQPPPPSTSLSLFPCQSIATNINKDKTEKPKAQCRFSIRYETGKVQARRKVNFCRFMVTITVTSQTGNRGYMYSLYLCLASFFFCFSVGSPPPPPALPPLLFMLPLPPSSPRWICLYTVCFH